MENKKKKRIDIIDGLIDGLYLAKSVEDYLMDTDLLGADEYFILDFLLAVLLTAGSLMSKVKWINQATLQKRKRELLIRLLQCMNKHWPYFRDSLSGLKNGRHAYINVNVLMERFGVFTFYMNPIGISVGVLLAPALLYKRYKQRKRDREIYNNHKLANQIKNGQAQNNMLQPYPSHRNRAWNYMLTSFDGITDGLYLFGCVLLILSIIGVQVLTVGVPLIIAAVAASMMALLSSYVKLNEEHTKQNELIASIDEINHAIMPKSLKINRIGFFWRSNRVIINCLKNTHAAIVEVTSLILRATLRAAGRVCGLAIGGLLLGVIYAKLMLSRNKINSDNTESKKTLFKKA